MPFLSRPNVDLVSSLSIMLFAFLNVVISTLAFIILLPSTLIALFLGFDAIRSGGLNFLEVIPGTMIIAWLAVALLIATHNIVVGLALFDNPEWKVGAKIVLLSAFALATCPVFWAAW